MKSLIKTNRTIWQTSVGHNSLMLISQVTRKINIYPAIFLFQSSMYAVTEFLWYVMKKHWAMWEMEAATLRPKLRLIISNNFHERRSLQVHVSHLKYHQATALSGSSPVSTGDHVWGPPNPSLTPRWRQPCCRGRGAQRYQRRQVCPHGSPARLPPPGNPRGNRQLSPLPRPLGNPWIKLWDSEVLKHWGLGSKHDKNTQIEKVSAL